MSRFTRISFLLVMVLAVTTTGALANIPSPELSEVPDRLTFGTGTLLVKPGVGSAPLVDNPVGRFRVHVVGVGGLNVANALVEVEFAPDINLLVAWCVPHTPPLFSATTDANGIANFEFSGGGCIIRGSFPHVTYVSQVRADGIVLKEPDISSPDAVNNNGKLPTTTPRANNCIAGITKVGLSDAVFHSPGFKNGGKHACSKFVPPFNADVALLDAVYGGAYIKVGNSCTCM